MKIKEGYRVGKLTVSSDSGIRKNGYMVWNCSCECGGSILLDTRALQRGLIRDCGCESKVKPSQKDLTGQLFGKLTALEPTQDRDRNGVTVWKCKCDCGNEVLVSAALLKNGYKKSCGCLHKALTDLTGQQFGELTVIESAGRHNSVLYWRCRCSCGKETVVRHVYLRDGKTRSCGCFHAKSFVENMKFVDETSVKMLEKIPERLNSSNSSGYNGIYFNRKNQKWIAQITFKRKTYYLGSYEKIEDAVLIRKEAETQIYGSFLEWYYSQEDKKENGILEASKVF